MRINFIYISNQSDNHMKICWIIESQCQTGTQIPCYLTNSILQWLGPYKTVVPSSCLYSNIYIAGIPFLYKKRFKIRFNFKVTLWKVVSVKTHFIFKCNLYYIFYYLLMCRIYTLLCYHVTSMLVVVVRSMLVIRIVQTTL